MFVIHVLLLSFTIVFGSVEKQWIIPLVPTMIEVTIAIVRTWLAS